jgi:hypothetical protein
MAGRALSVDPVADVVDVRIGETPAGEPVTYPLFREDGRVMSGMIIGDYADEVTNMAAVVVSAICAATPTVTVHLDPDGLGEVLSHGATRYARKVQEIRGELDRVQAELKGRMRPAVAVDESLVLVVVQSPRRVFNVSSATQWEKAISFGRDRRVAMLTVGGSGQLLDFGGREGLRRLATNLIVLHGDSYVPPEVADGVALSMMEANAGLMWTAGREDPVELAVPVVDAGALTLSSVDVEDR